MHIAMFYHTLLSDWNHGNAHFLRGIATELLAQGHAVEVFEPENSWSLQNLVAEHGRDPLRRFHQFYPTLKSNRYHPAALDVDAALERADLILVHEWNGHDLVRRIGEHRRQRRDCTLLFHDTHHRMATDRASMAAYDLSNYDGVLAFGKVLQELYEAEGWVKRAWTWHEAADIRVFKPASNQGKRGDLVWIGNWGDDERTVELEEFLIEPTRALSLKTRVHGVRYPSSAKARLSVAGIEYGDWLPNFEVPKVFGDFKVTAHIPRRPYVKALPGIPTIRMFEAMACGIPLVCSPWEDTERLFHAGTDFLMARNGKDMRRVLKALLNDNAMAHELSAQGLKTIHARHTCAHRVDELLNIVAQLRQFNTAIS